MLPKFEDHKGEAAQADLGKHITQGRVSVVAAVREIRRTPIPGFYAS